MAALVGGARAVDDRVVRFVRARRPDRALVDEVGMRGAVALDGGARADAGAEATTAMESARDAGARGMSTRGIDRGDDLYATREVRMRWGGARRAGAGLGNLGNTCFLNSVLQCLTHTPALAHFALNGEHKKYKTNDSFNALYEIGEHVARALHSSGKTIAPTAVVKNLRVLSKTFRKGRQEDAHELARCLLDAMHKKCVEIVKPKISPNSARAETSFVWKVFGGKLRSRINCKTCGRNSDTFDPFLDLSLEVGRAKSVLGAFKLFTHTEILDGDNKYKCEGKNPGHSKPHFTKASKQFTIDQTPNVLAVQLKRFAYVPFGRGKMSHFVEYPLELDISPYLSEARANSRDEAVYDLYGVLVHAGNSSNSGHYYCFVKTATGTWCEMDDESVSPVSEKVVLKQQAYLLFYARRNAPGTFEDSKMCRNIPDEEAKKYAAMKVQSVKASANESVPKQSLALAGAKPKTSPQPEVVTAAKPESHAKESKPAEPLKKESHQEIIAPPAKRKPEDEEDIRISPVRLSVGKGIIRSKSPSMRSAFDSAKRALLLRRLKRLSYDVGVTLEDAAVLEPPVRTRIAKKDVESDGVDAWLSKAKTPAKWDEEEDNVDERKGGDKKRKNQASSESKTFLQAKRPRREYDQFDEEYDRGKIPKHRRRRENKTVAPALPRPGAHKKKKNPFQRR